MRRLSPRARSFLADVIQIAKILWALILLMSVYAWMRGKFAPFESAYDVIYRGAAALLIPIAGGVAYALCVRGSGYVHARFKRRRR